MAQKKRSDKNLNPVVYFPLLSLLYLIGVGIATGIYMLYRFLTKEE